MTEINNRIQKYCISLRPKGTYSYAARTTINIGGESIRLEKGGKTEELAILNLLNAILEYINSAFTQGLIQVKIDDIVSQRLVGSINNLGLVTNSISAKLLEVVNAINEINSKILNSIYVSSNVVPYNQNANVLQLYNDVANVKIAEASTSQIDTTLYSAELFIREWCEYKFSLCKKTADNPKPLSRRTFDDYNSKVRNNILPFIKKKKIKYLQDIDEECITELLKNVNGQDSKRIVYIVLNLIFKYAIKKHLIINNPVNNIKKPVQLKKNIKKKEEDYILPNEQAEWLDIFEKYDSDMGIQFKTMLLTGIRPEEACGLKWSALDVENKLLDINNAYKDFKVYDENMNPIGHERRDDSLKTEESYRKIPINDSLIESLLKHKEKQKLSFQNSRAIKRNKRKWSENEYMFLGRTYHPYVSETISKGMKKLVKQYDLKRKITPYGLRYSFATYWAQKGMDQNVLARLMRS